MEAYYTPWSVSQEEPRDIVDSQGTHIGRAYRVGGSPERYESQGRHHARLFAAAPDLLEACRKFLKANGSRDEQEMAYAIHDALAAIAKAASDD